MFSVCFGILLVARLACSASVPDDGVSLLQIHSQYANRASLQQKPLTLVAQCTALAPSLHRSSGAEALPIIQKLTDRAKALLELGSTSMERSCILPITGNALFDHPFALLANKTQGTTPLEIAIETVRRYPQDAGVQQTFLPAITNLADPVNGDELVAEVQRLGGLDSIFRALHYFTADEHKDVLMMAWAALSDFTHTRAGAAALANHGSTLQGCSFAMEQMRAFPQPYYAETFLHLTLKYEILQNVNGMLKMDFDGTYGRACLQAGLAEQIVYTMRAENGNRASQDIACEVAEKLVQHDPAAVSALREAGAMEPIRNALQNFSGGDSTPFLAGADMGSAYPVAVNCRRALALLESSA